MAAPAYLQRLSFALPARSALPTLDRYARLEHKGESRVTGYVEASRGCLHLCTHCPIPPVYNGRFFVIPQDIAAQPSAATEALAMTLTAASTNLRCRARSGFTAVVAELR